MAHAHRLTGDRKIKLSDFDPADTAGLTKEGANARLDELTGELQGLQELLYAAGQMSVLVVLQGRDTSGKDGAIRNVFGPLNSQACAVASFKQPTGEELAHDFLWRVHRATPARGHITVFNRSHYEDVLVVRVHKLVPAAVWKKRYQQINDFERLLAESRTVVLKFYLHIDAEEQMERLLKREQDATKFWKLSVGDWREREHWDDYTAAYEDALNECSTADAPWFVVPANKKWYRNVVIAETIADALRPHADEWKRSLEESGRRELQAIEEYRGQQKKK